MARIFISHSSKNKEETDLVKNWLDVNGFDQIFLDYDKESGIPIGSSWEQTLYDEIERSQAVIIVFTPDWNASKWCFSEYTQARALGKKIYPLRFFPSDKYSISGTIQYYEVQNKSTDSGEYKRLLKELRLLSLNTQEGFEWDRTRSLYPGMLSFKEEDAAIFFGRDADILRVIENLNARRIQGGSRLLVLLGSSGSGKSSLLKAGVLPRLRRNQQDWIILDIFEPDLRPLRSFARVLRKILGKNKDVNYYYEQLLGSNAIPFLREIADQIQDQEEYFSATILISVDQSEELFSVANNEEKLKFFQIISQLKYQGSPWLCIFTLRSDFLGYLQNTEQLTIDFTQISLKPMPFSHIGSIIRGPAKVAGLSVEPELVAAATEDAKTSDALPLLAFALKKLYDNYGKDGNLTLSDYQNLGNPQLGLSPLENIVQEEANKIVKSDIVDKHILQALREAFIPPMVRVNTNGEYVRRRANWSELPEKSYELIEELAKSRLLFIKQDNSIKTVEVCHEALLRRWPLLNTWLNESHEFLVNKPQLERSLTYWKVAKETHKQTTLLKGLPLQRAHQWLSDQKNILTQDEIEFIQASVKYDKQEKQKVKDELLRANYYLAKAFEEKAMRAFDKGDKKNHQNLNEYRRAWLYAFEAKILDLPKGKVALSHSSLKKLTSISVRDLINKRVSIYPFDRPAPSRHKEFPGLIAYSHDGSILAVASHRKTVYLWEVQTSELRGKLEGHRHIVNSVEYSPSGLEIATASSDKTIRLWDTTTTVCKAVLVGHTKEVNTATYSPDGLQIASASKDKNILLWDLKTGQLDKVLVGHTAEVTTVSFSKDGLILVSVSWDKTVRLWDYKTGKLKQSLEGHSSKVLAVTFSPDNRTIATASADRSVILWDIATGKIKNILVGHSHPIIAVTYCTNGVTLTSYSRWDICVWDIETNNLKKRALIIRSDPLRITNNYNNQIASLAYNGTVHIRDANEKKIFLGHHLTAINSVIYSPDGLEILSASYDNTIHIWDSKTKELKNTIKFTFLYKAFFNPSKRVSPKARAIALKTICFTVA